MYRIHKQFMALLLAISVLSAMLPLQQANAAETDSHYVLSGNMVQNPGFESGTTNWTIIKGGLASNNKHSGTSHFFLNSGSDARVSQTINIPYNGYYNASAWITTGGSGARFGVRYSDQTVVKETVLPANSSYQAPYSLSNMHLKQGDKVEIYCSGTSSWVNGDDFSFTYDESKIDLNLLLNGDFSGSDDWNLTSASIGDHKAVIDSGGSAAQMVRVPRKGPYYLQLSANPAQTMTLSVNSASKQISPSNESQTVTLETGDLNQGDEANIMISGEGEIQNASFKFDVSKIPNEPPVAKDVSITGTARANLILHGQYTFTDPDAGQEEGGSVYQWLIGDSVDGAFSAIENSNSRNLTVTKSMEGKYIKFKVTPYDNYGKAGQDVSSQAAGPVTVNLIVNPGFEIEQSDLLGWVYTDGNKSHDTPYDGLLKALLNAKDSALVYQDVTVPQSGYYNIGAYVKCDNAGGELGVRNPGCSKAISSVPLTQTSGYQFVSIPDVALEKGSSAEVYIKGTSACPVSVDNVEMIRDISKGTPKFTNIKSFAADEQIGYPVINNVDKTVNFHVPYGTDITKIHVYLTLSEGGTSTPSETGVYDFTHPVAFKVLSDNMTSNWTVTCTLDPKSIILSSSSKYLADNFNWAVNKSKTFVQTGKTGSVNVDETNTAGTGTASYIPSYWAGYHFRTGFYSRDFAHQTSGAHMVGLDNENFSMFKAFAKSASLSRKWYALWSMNFDGTPLSIDYVNDNHFVREIPAEFELVEKIYHQYLWTGDKRYLTDPDISQFCNKAVTDFISLHDDRLPNGVPEGNGDIFSGSSTYNERGENPLESGDEIGSEYQALLAYAGMLKAKGDDIGSQLWLTKAQNLKDYFNQTWSQEMGNDNFARVICRNNSGNYFYKLTDFGKENSWFMPMKLITEPGERNNKYLDFISTSLGSGIGNPNAPTNIEAYTYLPDTYFPYNKTEEAWKWMKYIADQKDNHHETSLGGINGDYPEVSYTFVSSTIEGMMGIEANAPQNTVVTASRLPKDIGWVKADYVKAGTHDLSVKHDGLTKSTLTNLSDSAISWEVRFYGDYNTIQVNDKYLTAFQKDVNGVKVSYAVVPVGAKKTVQAQVTSSVKMVTSFDELDATVKTQSVPNGTPYKSLNLPSSLKVTAGSQAETIRGITWTSVPSYAAATAGTYTFTTVLPKGYELADGITAPVITVIVSEKRNDNSHHSDKNSSGNPKGRETAPSSSSTILETMNEKGGTDATVTTRPDTAPVVVGGRASVSVSVPEDVVSVVAFATAVKPVKVKITAPASDIVQQLNDRSVQAVDLNITVPGAVSNNTNPNAEISVSADPSVLQAAGNTQKDITLSVTNGDTGRKSYSWTFSGKGLNHPATSITGINLSINVSPVRNDASASSVVERNTAGKKPEGVVLRFGHSALLPDVAKVRVYVGDQEGCTANSKVFLYYLDHTINALEQLPQSEYTVDAEGYVTITIAHCSDYVLLPKAATNPYPVHSDTCFPVGIKSGKSYTFAMTVSGNAVPTFTIGNGKAFTTSVKRQGNKYYYTVKAIGAVDTMSAIYCALPKEKSIVICYVSVAKQDD
ncbi:Ig-like domain-containing protein [Caproiciproducens sp.]|uniref:Ig-like domain-containing protein n=1 Tax=Caproiciproducens sp. TaxID=1954376 RepID=UPI0028966E6E|nr:Ig-like domain-containing protein [Caproiciproducens sp.]